MAVDHGVDTGVLAMLIAGASFLLQLITGRRQDQRETEDQRRVREQARKAEIHEESIRAVLSSQMFVLSASQDEVNDRLLADVTETKDAVKGLGDKFDRFLLNASLEIRKRD